MVEIVARGVSFHVQRLAPATLSSGPSRRPPVVFVHGLVADDLSGVYLTLAGPLTQAGFEVMLYDLRGHGLSQRPPSAYRAEDSAADLFAILDVLQISAPVILAGYSFGGILASHAALLHPDRAAGLVLLDSTFAGPTADRWIEDTINTISALALRSEIDRMHEQVSGLHRKLAKKLVSVNDLLNRTSMIDDLAATAAIPGHRLSDMHCPVLAIFGENSLLRQAAVELAHGVPDCSVVVLANVGHDAIFTSTAQTCHVLTEWLTDKFPPGR